MTKILQIDIDIDDMKCEIKDPCTFYISKVWEMEPQVLGEFVGEELSEDPEKSYIIGQAAKKLDSYQALNRLLVREHNINIRNANDITCRAAKKAYERYIKDK